MSPWPRFAWPHQRRYRYKLMLLLIALHIARQKKEKKRKKRQFWIHPLLKTRKSHGEYHNLVRSMRILRQPWFFTYFRMTAEVFDELLCKIAPEINKMHTHMREPISAGERLAVTLRFLATGNSYTSIAHSYRMHKSTVSQIVPDTCKALWKVLQPEVMPTPTKYHWEKIAEEYNSFWQFPHCLGSIDGKHVLIQAPSNSGSIYFNYKKTFSIVLMAVVDALYNFIVVDVGAYGRQSDGSVFGNSVFGKSLKSDLLDLPRPASLPGSAQPMPYVFVADEAFPLRCNLMRPFPGTNLSHKQRIFNYRLSRARRIVENAFGIMSSRFRVFHRPLLVRPETVDDIIKACTVLHNFLRRKVTLQYVEPTTTDYENRDGVIEPGQWRADTKHATVLQPFLRTGRRHSIHAAGVRNEFMNYFSSPLGSVPWQNDVVTRM